VAYLYKGVAAGLMGALVLSAYLLLNIETGWIPALDFIALIGQVTATGAAGAWIIHFAIGALLGALFAWLDPDLPGNSLRQRGMILAGVAWLFMMFFLMPYAGYGVLGLKQSVLIPIGALVLHMIFGIIMGGTYGWLVLQAMPLRYRHVRERMPARAVAPVQSSQPVDAKPAEPTQPEMPAVHVPPTVEVVRPSVVPLVPGKSAPLNAAKRTARRSTNGGGDQRARPLNGGQGAQSKAPPSAPQNPRQPTG
jgi:hypothetical protein